MPERIDNITIPDSNSSCQEWKNYYDQLEKEFGDTNAQEAWLYAWGVDSNDMCTKDAGFNKWAERNNIAVADGLDKAVASTSAIGHNILNGIGTLTGLTPKIGAAVLIGGTGLALFLTFRLAMQLKPADLLGMLPPGRMGKMANALNK